MIFVTVGTHEQPFNRLIQKIDELKKDGIINEDVIIQTGFSTYEPKYCQWSKLIPYQQMVKNVADARIVITHGGPASFIMPLQIGKTPIVVPRQHQFNEHVNDHQVEFARNVAQRMGTIIPVEDINTLGDIITNYDQIVAGMGHGMSSNNAKFNEELEKLVTPFELLKAFQNAECIVTDTFHGTLFGAKFGKRMAVLIRESNQNKLEDLTQRLQIQSHVITDISQLNTVLKKELDKKKIGEILGLEREKSLKYLKENL